MAECAKDITITTSCSIQIKGQLPAPPSGEQDIQARGTSGHLIALTSRTCLAALSFITDAVLKEWNCLETLPAAPKKKRRMEKPAARSRSWGSRTGCALRSINRTGIHPC